MTAHLHAQAYPTRLGPGDRSLFAHMDKSRIDDWACNGFSAQPRNQKVGITPLEDAEIARRLGITARWQGWAALIGCQSDTFGAGRYSGTRVGLGDVPKDRRFHVCRFMIPGPNIGIGHNAIG